MTPPSPRPLQLLLPRLLAPTALLLAGLLAGCADPESEAGAVSAREPSASSVESDVLDLVAAVTKLSATVPAGEQHAWYGRRRDTLERLRAASHAHGLEALREYHARADSLREIRIGLLDVAAHAAPEETRPVLVDLVREFGDDLAVRTEAAVLLGKTSPEKAIEVLEPILRRELTGRTYPAEYHLLDGWNAAALELDLDRIPLLCLIATDLPRDMEVRHYAIKLLGTIESSQGRQALEQLLVESSGNHMLRRYAAQSLRDSLPPEELCPILRRVLDREADPNFQIFVDNMILENCR
jgi:HEAT repeat protein